MICYCMCHYVSVFLYLCNSQLRIFVAILYQIFLTVLKTLLEYFQQQKTTFKIYKTWKYRFFILKSNTRQLILKKQNKHIQILSLKLVWKRLQNSQIHIKYHKCRHHQTSKASMVSWIPLYNNSTFFSFLIFVPCPEYRFHKSYYVIIIILKIYL